MIAMVPELDNSEQMDAYHKCRKDFLIGGGGHSLKLHIEHDNL